MADEPNEPRDDGDDGRREKPSAGRRGQRPPARARRSRRDRDRDRDQDDERHEHDDPRAFARILERRWVGSAPPTAERYALALRQWAALPGAIASLPTTAVASLPTPADRSPAPAPRPSDFDR